ncbi:NAD(P)/FAD-dependent oxidoreductase [Candidatus Bipolaricaulota bacterium]|nr:NAD(P)/FAD-dependent oxidoreductase [Candidatus Bipolaricaulota bacterium]
MSKVLIIGNGVAGSTAASVISRANQEVDLKVFTREKHPFYQRTRLGEVLGGKSSAKDIILHDTQWYAERNIDLQLETTVGKIDPEKKIVKNELGGKFSYNKLLLAPGAKPLLPPISGLNKGNVFSLRTLKDVRKIKSQLNNVKDAVVIGGGLLGLESAFALKQRVQNVTVVEALPIVMGKQLDKTGSKYVQARLESIGIDFKLNARAKELTGGKLVTSAVLNTGETVRTDMVIISAGISPRTELAESGGLETSRGIIVDKTLRTSDDEIFAAGDAMEQNGRCYGIWPPAQEQGKIAGKNLIGGEKVYEGSLSYFKLKVAGIDMISAGIRDEERAREVLVNEKESEQTYKKFFLNENEELIGAILVGNQSCYPAVLNGLRTRKTFDQLNAEEQLIN